MMLTAGMDAAEEDDRGYRPDGALMARLRSRQAAAVRQRPAAPCQPPARICQQFFASSLRLLPLDAGAAFL